MVGITPVGWNNPTRISRFNSLFNMKQHTIKKNVSATGIGVHSGENVTITLKAAPVNTGIIFWRQNYLGSADVPATVDNVTNTLMATTIGKAPYRVTMV